MNALAPHKLVIVSGLDTRHDRASHEFTVRLAWDSGNGTEGLEQRPSIATALDQIRVDLALGNVDVSVSVSIGFRAVGCELAFPTVMPEAASSGSTIRRARWSQWTRSAHHVSPTYRSARAQSTHGKPDGDIVKSRGGESLPKKAARKIQPAMWKCWRPRNEYKTPRKYGACSRHT